MDEVDNKLGDSLRLLAKTSFIVFLGVFLSKVFTYLYKVIIARSFGPESYGLFSLAFMIAGIFSALASLGLSEGILRYASVYKSKGKNGNINYIVRMSILVSAFSGILVSAVLFLNSGNIATFVFHNPKLIIYLKIMSLTVPFIILAGVYLSVVRAFEKISAYSFATNIFQNGFKLAILITLILVGFGEKSILASYFIGVAGFFALSYFFGERLMRKIKNAKKAGKKERLKIRKEVFSYSWPIVFLLLINSFFYWIDSFTIGFYKDASSVGLYNVAISIVALFGIAPDLFMQLFFPLAVKEYTRKNMKLIRETSKQIAKWIFLINIPLLVILIAFPGVIINILFGETYLAAENALRILAIGGFFSSLTISLQSSLLSMVGKSKTILYDIIASSIVNLTLNIILVPKFGFEGAAVGTLISWIFLNSLFLVQVRKHTSIVPFRRKMIRISIVSLIPIAAVFVLKGYVGVGTVSVILLGIFFILFYSILIFTTGCLDRNDMEVLSSVASKAKNIRMILKRFYPVEKFQNNGV